MSKTQWHKNGIVQSVLATADAREDLRVLETVLRADVKDKTVNALKRSEFDVKSFELWSQDIPEVKELEIGDTFEVPHFTYKPYNREYDGVLNVCNARFKVLDKKTIKKSIEVLNAEGTKFANRKLQSTYVLIESDQERWEAPDSWFERCANFSARKNYGNYYPLKKKKKMWVSQREILMMFFKDGGMCALKRRQLDCTLCDK